jgi:hypothetical protein
MVFGTSFLMGRGRGGGVENVFCFCAKHVLNVGCC